MFPTGIHGVNRFGRRSRDKTPAERQCGSVTRVRQSFFLFFLTFLGRDLPLVPLQILPRFVRRSPLPMVLNSPLLGIAMVM